MLCLQIDIEISPIDSAAGPMEMPPFTPLSTAPPRPARQSVLVQNAAALPNMLHRLPLVFGLCAHRAGERMSAE